MIIDTKLKKWGNSKGIVIPVDILVDENLKEGDEVIVEIKKKNKIKELFGSLKGWKFNSQKLKDEIREEEWKNG